MRVLAIGDIHGCRTALETLLAQVLLQPDDLLITLGDYVDRGPDVCGVIDCLLAVRATHHLVALRGNHDLMMLEARDGTRLSWISSGGRETLASYGVRIRKKLFGFAAVPAAHWQFLAELRSWYETERHIFVHAGVDADLEMDEQSEYNLHFQKVVEPIAHRSGKIIVCGHTKQYTGLPTNLGSTILIDTGAYDEQGWLTCLNVNTGGFWQANQRGQTRTGHLAAP